MPHEVPGVFNTLLHRCRGFHQDDLERAADAVSQMPLGRTWFRPEGVVATSSFASTLQATYSDLSKVVLELPEGLLIGLGCAATNPGSCWSLMLPTSVRVAQEVNEPLIGMQYPMLRSRLGDTWQLTRDMRLI